LPSFILRASACLYESAHGESRALLLICEVSKTLNDRTQQDRRDLRLEKARKDLSVALDALRSAGTLTAKDADAQAKLGNAVDSKVAPLM
jgi:hypothetical protein